MEAEEGDDVYRVRWRWKKGPWMDSCSWSQFLFVLLSGRGDLDVFSLQMKETYPEHPISGPQRPTHSENEIKM